MQQLLEHPLINSSFIPESEGAIQQAQLQGGANAAQQGDPRYDTADFADGTPGNLRSDYVLPSRSLPSSDHRLVWVDLRVAGQHGA